MISRLRASTRARLGIRAVFDAPTAAVRGAVLALLAVVLAATAHSRSGPGRGGPLRPGSVQQRCPDPPSPARLPTHPRPRPGLSITACDAGTLFSPTSAEVWSC